MAVSFDEFISKWKSFEDFEKKRESTWTVDIDLSKFEKMQKAFETMEASARKTFGKSGIFQFDDAEKATTYIRKLDDNITKLEQRYEQLKQTAELFSKASAEKGGDKELSDKANAATAYAQSLQRVIDVYRSSKSAVTRSKGGSGYDLDDNFMSDERIKQIAERTKELDKRAEEYNKALERVGVVKAPQQEQNQEQNQEKSSEKTIEQLKAEAEAKKKQYQEWDANKKAQQKEESPDATIIKNVEWMGESIADSTPIVQELASQIKSVGVDATATSVAMQQIGESGEDALTRVANLTATVQEGLQFLNSEDAFSGYLNMALEDAQTQEGIDAISRLIEIAKNYKEVLEMLIVAEEKANQNIAPPQNSASEDKPENVEKLAENYDELADAKKNASTVKIDDGSGENLDSQNEKITDQEERLESLKKTKDAVGDNLKNAVGGGQTPEGAEEQTPEVAEEQEPQKTREELQAKLEELQEERRAVLEKYEELARAKSTGGADIPQDQLDGLIAKYQELQTQIDSTKASLKELNNSDVASGTEAVAGVVEQSKEVATNTEESVAETSSARPLVERDSIESVEELSNKINEVRQRIAQMRAEAQSGNMSGSLEDYEQNINDANEQLKFLLKTQETIYGRNQPKEDQEDVPSATNPMTYDEARKRQKELPREISRARTEILDSDDIEGAIQRVKDLEEELQRVNSIVNQASTGTYGAQLAESFKSLGGHLKNAVGGIASVFAKATASVVKFQVAVGKVTFNAIAQGAQMALQGIKTLANGAYQATSALTNFGAQGIGVLAKGASAGAQGMAKLATGGFSLVKKGAEGAKNAMQGLASKFTSLGGHTSKNLLKSLTSIKSMLKRRVKRTFISAIFNQAKEGMQQLAKFDAGFNSAMSNIKNSSKQAAGNLAVTMGNIVQMIAPAIEWLLNLLSSVFEKINAVFALLGGKSTVKTAKKGTDDYAKSLKSAGGAAKDLNKQLYGFDEITRQEDNSSSGGGSKIGYEDKNVADILDDRMKAIMDAIQNGQWEKAGELVGKALSDVVKVVDEKLIEFRPIAKQWAKNIAEFGNGFVKGFDWKLLGKTIGDGLNLVMDTLNTFLTTFDFKALGDAFATGVNGIFDSVEWDLLGETLANGYNAVWRTMEGFVSKANWAKYGKSFAQAVDSFAKNIDFTAISDTVSGGLNGISEMLLNFATDLDLTETMKNLGASITKAIKDIKWKQIGTALGKGISDLFADFNTLMEAIDFVALGNGLADGIMGMFDAVDWDTLGETFGTYYNKIFDGLLGFVEKIDFDKIAKDLTKGINGFINKIDWSKLKTALTTGINKLIPALRSIITGVDWTKLATDLATNINGVITGVNWKELGDTLGTGVNTVFGTIKTFMTTINFEDIGKSLGDGISSIISTVNWEEVGSTVASFTNSAFSAISGLATSINWEELGKALSGYLTGLSDSIDWETITTAVTTSVNGLITAFTEIVNSEAIVNLASNLGTTIGNILSEIDWETLATDIGTGIGKLVEAFGNFLTNLNLPDVATKLADGINALFDPEKGGAGFDTALEALSTGVNSLIEGFAKLVSEEDGINFKQIASTLATSINGLIKNTDWATLLSTIAGLKLDLYDALFKAIGEIDWATLGTKLATAINGIFTEERMASLGTNIGKALTGVLEGLTTLISDIDWEKVGEGIITFIKNINWGEVLTNIVNLLISAVSGIGSLITGLWNAIFGGGGEEVEVPQVLSDDVMEQLKQQMGNAGKELAHTLNQAIIDNIDDAGSDYEAAKQLFLNSAAEIALGHQAELEKTLREQHVSEATIASLTQQTQDIFNACKPSDATIDDIKSTFRNSGIWICDELAQAFVGQGSENIGLALQLMALGVDQKTIAALDMTHLNENMTNYMNESGATIEEIAGTLGANVGTKIGGTVPEFINKALEEGKETVAETAKEIQEVADTSASQVEAGQNASATGEAITDNLAEGMDGTKTSTKAEAVKKTIDDKIAELPEAEQANAKAMMDMMVQGILEGDPLVQTAIENSATAVVDKVKKILAGSEGKKIVNTFLSGMKTAINSNFDLTVKNPLATLSGQAINAVALRLNYDNGYTIMYNVLQGMYDAVANGNGQAVVDIFTQVAQALIDTVKAILGIHSPSRVFNEIGAYTMQGMEDGLLSSGDNAIDTVANIVDQMINEGSGVELDASFSAVSSGLDVATDKLSRIADIFSGIADTLVQMGGLQVPTIATGQTIPYRTQLEAMPTASQTAMSDPHALEDAIYSAFTRAIGNTEDDRQVNITLQIDGRKMADIVSKYQRQQSRAWGV